MQILKNYNEYMRPDGWMVSIENNERFHHVPHGELYRCPACSCHNICIDSEDMLCPCTLNSFQTGEHTWMDMVEEHSE